MSYASDPQGTSQAPTSTPAAAPLDPLDKIAMLMTIQPPGMTPEKDAQTLEAQIGKAKAELAVKVQVDASEFQKTLKAEMEQLNSNLSGMIKKIVATELKLEDTKFAAGRATTS